MYVNPNSTISDCDNESWGIPISGNLKKGLYALATMQKIKDAYKNRALLRNSPAKIGLFARIPHRKPL